MSRREWYSEGLRFECTMCGACCTGPPGFVSFTEAEGRDIAARLGVSYVSFLERYTHKGAAGPSLNEVETEHGFDCVFLDRQSVPGKAVCSIHEARPKQCRTFPWWPEVLESPRAWARAAKRCEGIDRGRLVPVEEIRVSVRSMRKSSGRD